LYNDSYTYMSSSFSRKIFTDFFPPPRFLEMPTVGLDITDDIIRYAELKRVGAHLGMGVYGEVKVPSGVIEEGYIKDKMALTDILSTIQKQHGFRFVVASLPEEKSYLFKTVIPMMPEADMRNAIQFKIEENVPIALTDAIFDYALIKHPQPEDAELQVAVTAIHSKVVSYYLEVIHGAGFVPLRLMTESQAIGRVVVAPTDPHVYIVAALRKTKAIFLIISGGVIHFTSTISLLGTETSTEQIAGPLQDEIQKLISYWQSHGEGKVIEQIIISCSSTMKGLTDQIARSSGISVRIADAWKNIAPVGEYLPQITLDESQEYIPVLGLAMPHD
jgi:Tfp pilus assembly PilM family ATPase